MESTKSNDFQSQRIIAFAMMGGLAFFAAIVAYLVSSGSPTEPGAIFSSQMDLLLVGGFTLFCIVMSRFLFNNVLNKTSSEDRKNYPTAIVGYRTALIVRLAMLEGAGLFACSIGLATNNLNLVIISFFVVAIMWMARPSETEFAEWRQQ